MDLVAALVAALPSALALTGDDIADALWLAAAACPPGDEPARPVPGPPGPPMVSADVPRSPALARRLPDDRQDSVPASQMAGEDVPVRRVAVAPVRYRADAAHLNLAWALRPFKRRWPRGSRHGLDVEATVRTFAYTRQLLPVLKAVPERWFDLHIVVDGQPSMRPWLPRVATFAGQLDRLGAFRMAHRWLLERRDGAWILLDRQGRPARPGRLRSPQSRSLVVVASTFAADAWAAQAPWDLVREWAESTPTALVNVLPTRLWRYSALHFPTVRATAAYPGAPSRGLVTRAGQRSAQLLLPVVSLSPSSVARWAAALMQTDPRGCHALPLPADATVLEAQEDVPGPALASSFLVTASTNAIRLAAFCSVLHRIPLEIFDLLQTEFVPEAGPDDVTEFVLSGLVELRADGQGGPWYMFRPGVPGVLSTRLPVADAWRLYSRLIDHLAVASGDPDLAEAVLYEVGRDVDVPAAARPYAFASQNLLRALGWQQPATAPQPEATGPQQAAGDPAAVDPAGGSRVSERDPQVPVARLDVLAGERTSDRVTHSDSVLYRRRLSNELRKIREAAGMSQRDVAAAMDWSQSKLLRIETGVVNISINDLRALLSHYGANQNKIATMLDLARSAREVPGWSLYRDVAAPEHVAFLGYESSASVIRSFEPTLVPALLQTEEYAREALGALEATDPQHIDALIDLRMQRQELLTIENPPQLHFILDESVIWRRVGGHAVMRRQLELLLEWSARPNVTIRIVPFSQGVYSKMNVPYVYFEFPAPEDDGLLYIEYPLGNRIINEYPGADTDRLATAYAATFWRLEQLASSEVFRRRVEHQIAQYPASFGTDANTRSRA